MNEREYIRLIREASTPNPSYDVMASALTEAERRGLRGDFHRLASSLDSAHLYRFMADADRNHLRGELWPYRFRQKLARGNFGAELSRADMQVEWEAIRPLMDSFATLISAGVYLSPTVEGRRISLPINTGGGSDPNFFPDPDLDRLNVSLGTDEPTNAKAINVWIRRNFTDHLWSLAPQPGPPCPFQGEGYCYWWPPLTASVKGEHQFFGIPPSHLVTITWKEPGLS